MNTIDGQLFFSQAPEFKLVELIAEESQCDSDVISGVPTIWTKNGDYIIWSGVGPAEDFMANDVMIIHRDGSQFRSLDNGWRGTKSAGWADSITLFVSYYGGGGTREGFFVNIVTGEKLHLPRRYPHFYPPNLFYLPVQEFSFPNAVSVTDRLLRRSSLESGEIGSHPPGGSSQGITYAPSLDTIEGRTGVLFIDWVPDKENALVLITQNSLRVHEDSFEANLALWEPRRETIRLLAKGGLSGEFSDDGNLLAISSKYPLLLDENGLLEGPDKTSVRADYLTILDMSSQKVVFATDTKSYTATGPDLSVEWTGGALVDFGWHPDNRQFIHRATSGHLTIVNLSTGEETILTEGYGERVRTPEWSHDGSYLKVIYWNKDPNASVYFPYRLPRTTILKVLQ